jgi:hypothetical protein
MSASDGAAIFAVRDRQDHLVDATRTLIGDERWLSEHGLHSRRLLRQSEAPRKPNRIFSTTQRWNGAGMVMDRTRDLTRRWRHAKRVPPIRSTSHAEQPVRPPQERHHADGGRVRLANDLELTLAGDVSLLPA